MKKINILRNLYKETFIVMVMFELSISLSSLIDGWTISKFLGEESMAAFGLLISFTTIIAMFGGIISSGSQTICAKLTAAGKPREANGVFMITCVMGALISVILLVCSFCFADEIIYFLGARKEFPEIWKAARNYLLGYTFAIPGIIYIIVLSPFLQLDGDKKRVQVSVIALAIVDIIGDLLNALVFHGGMFGMGIATAIGEYVAVIIIHGHFRNKDIVYQFRFRNILWKEGLKVLNTGFPVAMRRFSNTIKAICMNYIMLMFVSGTALTALSIQSNVKRFADVIAVATGSTLLLMIGIAVGEQDVKDVKNIFFGSIRFSLKYAGGLGIILFLLSKPIAIWYADDMETIRFATFAIRCYAVNLPLYTLNTMYINYVQGCAKIQLANFLSLCNRLLYIVPCAFLFGKIWGVRGVFVAYPASEAFMLLTICVVVMAYKRKLRISSSDFLLLEDDFGVPEEDLIEISISGMDEVIKNSIDVWNFCERHGIKDKRRFLFSLFVEEMAGNLIRHGFQDNKPHCIDIRIVKKNEDLILRLRDDCFPFNPKTYRDMFFPEDVTEHIGIRMVISLAKDVQYVNNMKTNNLTILV